MKDPLDERIAKLEAKVARYRNALTPSEETKRAYMGEFQFRLGEFPTVNVPWTTIKQIMSAILANAEAE
jgi:hypothetical protein